MKTFERRLARLELARAARSGGEPVDLTAFYTEAEALIGVAGGQLRGESSAMALARACGVTVQEFRMKLIERAAK